MKYINLEPGKYYHIYNRGINKGNLFFERDNYLYFMKLYKKHLLPIAKTYAYCLLPNHFHFLVKIKDEGDFLKVSQDFEHNQNNLWQPFSNLFNAYSKAINKKYTRTGGLFQYKFKRIEIKSDNYFYNLMVYIHQNPLKHEILRDFKNYEFLSYQAIIGNKATNIERNEIIKWYDTLENFIFCHSKEIDEETIKEYIIED